MFIHSAEFEKQHVNSIIEESIEKSYKNIVKEKRRKFNFVQLISEEKNYIDLSLLLLEEINLKQYNINFQKNIIKAYSKKNINPNEIYNFINFYEKYFEYHKLYFLLYNSEEYRNVLGLNKEIVKYNMVISLQKEVFGEETYNKFFHEENTIFVIRKTFFDLLQNKNISTLDKIHKINALLSNNIDLINKNKYKEIYDKINAYHEYLHYDENVVDHD